MNLPSFKLGPKPKAWDLIALVVLGVAAAAAVPQLVYATNQTFVGLLSRFGQ